ncbi:BESS motif,Target SNARE coiled-coil homology domain [Cinara cedri]|uniref:BESS motif,Target SNARE coiled-coil homology domain n=1 Tax=Cinara cedri TaxID=506608 RepID=A0A5E4NLX5_9HEMI|nr:BESS motif,Target SNARE coiled-coil homology domain [Cinara cedri]
MNKRVDLVLKHRQYLYFNNLSFLKPVSERRQTESSINDTFQNVDEQFNSSDESQKVTKKRKSTKSIDNENELIKQLSHRLSDRMSKQDEQLDNIDSDKHFLLSLYDRFKSIDNNLKWQAQIEIMNVIQKYSQPNTQNYNYELFGRRLDNTPSHTYNTTEYETRQYPMYPHKKYPSHIEVSPFRAPTTVNVPEISPTYTQSNTSPDSISSQATDDDHDSTISNIFN